MARWANSKKAVILRLLKEGKPVSVKKVAKQLYDEDGLVGEIRVVNLISAYRSKDPLFRHVRILNKHICILSKNCRN